jgi:hypothetical protein
MVHLVLSEQNPGLANWIELLGRREGIMQFRWQRVDEPITDELGPTLKIVPFDSLPREVPGYAEQQVSPEQWRGRIAARQRAFARRGLT